MGDRCGAPLTLPAAPLTSQAAKDRIGTVCKAGIAEGLGFARAAASLLNRYKGGYASMSYTPEQIADEIRRRRTLPSSPTPTRAKPP